MKWAGPEAERQLAAEIAASGPQVRAMQKALVSSLPAIMGALEGVEKELEQAVANMPDPTYPEALVIILPSWRRHDDPSAAGLLRFARNDGL